MGGDSDGGYLIPDDLDGVDVCFSPGVSSVADFELDLTRRGIKCFLADYAVDAPPFQNSLFEFEKKFIGSVEDDMFMTLDNWVRRKALPHNELILQMDIEGAEYGVLYHADIETLKRFRIIVIEFHRFDMIFDESGFELMKLTFEKLMKEFEVVHIHPNNCSRSASYKKFAVPPIVEFTFFRRDRITQKVATTEFPHELDRKNVLQNDDVVLPTNWFQFD
jgi:hypothetical protein